MNEAEEVKRRELPENMQEDSHALSGITGSIG
jgi:hypothetical protein